MIDMQNSSDNRGIALRWVGISKYKHPIEIYGFSTIASTEFCVSLDKDRKAIHMSRLVEIIEDNNIYTDEIIKLVVDTAMKRLNSMNCYIELNFPLIIKKESPLTKKLAGVSYDCSIRCESNKNSIRYIYGLKIPISTVCPCSKAISAHGAHNQRGYAKIELISKHFLNLPSLINTIENTASSELFSLLKREDEKYVTEHAYDNAKFVEDVVRDIVISLQKLEELDDFNVCVENYESIHIHNAIAYFM